MGSVILVLLASDLARSGTDPVLFGIATLAEESGIALERLEPEAGSTFEDWWLARVRVTASGSDAELAAFLSGIPRPERRVSR